MFALQQRANALQPHAGVNAGLGQINARAVSLLFKLHEDEIPNLNKPIAIFIGTARWATGNRFAMVEENFRTRTTWPGIAHRPEIIRGRDANDFLFRQSGDFLPKAEGFFVFGIDCRQ